jgi:hypothetical protein
VVAMRRIEDLRPTIPRTRLRQPFGARKTGGAEDGGTQQEARRPLLSSE